MKNPWRVATNHICGEKHYQVYRFRHPGETDHAGNREWRGGIFMAYQCQSLTLSDEVFGFAWLVIVFSVFSITWDCIKSM